MQKGERLSGDLSALQCLWEGSDSALAILRSAARRLDRIAGEHPLLGEAGLARPCRDRGRRGRGSDRRRSMPWLMILGLDRIETPFDLRAAARKHGCTVDELPVKIIHMREALDAIENGEGRIAALERAAQEAGLDYRAKAEARGRTCRSCWAARRGGGAGIGPAQTRCGPVSDGGGPLARGPLGPWRR
jgi:DNA repair protein RecN (Recombination protein N)